jgi:uncharacterized repeat protein (TIGR01451 family)
MEDRNLTSKQPRSRAIVFSLIVAVVAILIMAQAIFAASAAVVSTETAVGPAQDGGVITDTIPVPGESLNMEADDAFGEYLRAQTTYNSDNGLNTETTVVDLSGSTKSVNLSEATAGATLNYTIVISNNDTIAANNVVVTDTLPAELTYQANTYQSVVVNGFTSSEFDGITYNDAITWTGSLGPGGYATLTFAAALSDTLAVDDVVTNSVMIDESGAVIIREAATTIVDEPSMRYSFMPIIFKPLNNPVVQVSRANSQNQWTVSWTDNNQNVTSYEIQESQDPNFATVSDTRNVAGNVSSTQFQRPLSTKNEYFYRVRLTANGLTSSWSNVASVVGGYYDDFTDPSTGWAIRRTTFLEEVRSWYEENNGDHWFIMQVEDSWDWGIAAPPKVKAPTLPYAIEYRVKIAHKANLVSHGAVFGADWPGGGCPDYSSLDGLYRHNICFNHFYNTNIIWFGDDLKLLFERVDYLEWRPQDGGSPMKRGSFDDFDSWFTVQDIPNVNDREWNTFRIEVRDSGIKLFANGQLYAQTADNLWVNEPYFGIFGSTDEYSNSTWRYDWYKAVPLDN